MRFRLSWLLVPTAAVLHAVRASTSVRADARLHKPNPKTIRHLLDVSDEQSDLLQGKLTTDRMIGPNCCCHTCSSAGANTAPPLSSGWHIPGAGCVADLPLRLGRVARWSDLRSRLPKSKRHIGAFRDASRNTVSNVAHGTVTKSVCTCINIERSIRLSR